MFWEQCKWYNYRANIIYVYACLITQNSLGCDESDRIKRALTFLVRSRKTESYRRSSFSLVKCTKIIISANKLHRHVWVQKKSSEFGGNRILTVLYHADDGLYVAYSDSIDAPNDRFRDEFFTIVRHRLLTKCWTRVRMLASGASINRRTFLETRQLKTSAHYFVTWNRYYIVCA